MWRSAVQRFLATPRAWVRAEADRYIARCGLVAGHFLTVHYRQSPQKIKERGRNALPAVAVYAAATERLLADGGLRPRSGLLLQTASPEGLAAFTEEWARMRAWSDPARDPGPLCFTNNRRTGSDAWAGQDARSNVTEEGAVAALNAHLSTLGGGLISPGASMWTYFLASLWPPYTLRSNNATCLPTAKLWCATRVAGRTDPAARHTLFDP